MSQPNQPILLTEKEAAKILGFSIRTLQKWRVAGHGPEYVKAGTAVRYRVEDIDAWIKSLRRSSTSSGANSIIT